MRNFAFIQKWRTSTINMVFEIDFSKTSSLIWQFWNSAKNNFTAIMYKYKVVYNIKIGILLFMSFSVKQTAPRENRKKKN